MYKNDKKVQIWYLKCKKFCRKKLTLDKNKIVFVALSIKNTVNNASAKAGQINNFFN